MKDLSEDNLDKDFKQREKLPLFYIYHNIDVKVM